jgi:sugar phosphate permease
MITGVIRTAVLFWMPTYFNEYLGYGTEASALIFTVAPLVISSNSFIAVGLYEALGRRRGPSLLILFGVSFAAFLLTFIVTEPILNIILLVIAVIGSNGAASILWSVYCPSLSDTGVVSSATGFLDFLSYTAAAITTVVFGNIVSLIGWGNLILVWAGLMVVGVIISLPYDSIRSRLCRKQIEE